MSKFKIGDKVTVVNKQDHYMHDDFLGKKGKIKELTSIGGYDYRVKFKKEEEDCFFESELEFTNIVESPLYQALK